MRPRSIVAFEYIEIAKVSLGLAVNLASDFLWSILTFGALLALVLFITRKGSRAAARIYIAIFIAGIPTTTWLVITHPGDFSALSTGRIIAMVVSWIASFVALWLLLSPSASRWIASSGAKDQLPA